MYTRVGMYNIDPDRMEDAVSTFEEAIERIRTMDGFIGASILVAPDDSKMLSITYWDSRGTMEASAVAASRARSDAARAADGEVESSCEYRVALHVRRDETRVRSS